MSVGTEQTSGGYRTRRLVAVAWLLTIVLFTAACSPNPNRQSPALDLGADLVQVAPTPDATNPAPRPGPLDEFAIRAWGTWVDGDPDSLLELARREHRIQEEYTAACMAEQGFTYLPELAVDISVITVEGPAIGSREFAELFGFGIVNFGGADQFTRTSLSEFPNQELLAEASEMERQAWWLALLGEGANDEGGCRIRAFHSLEHIPDPQFAALEDEILRFPASVDIAPEMMALAQEWTVCLANLGLSGYRNRNHLRDSLWDEFTEISDWDGAGAPDAQVVAAFRDRELVAAIADIDCREQLDFDNRQIEINHQLQQEFVNRNRNELEAWATFAETQQEGR